MAHAKQTNYLRNPHTLFLNKRTYGTEENNNPAIHYLYVAMFDNILVSGQYPAANTAYKPTQPLFCAVLLFNTTSKRLLNPRPTTNHRYVTSSNTNEVASDLTYNLTHEADS